MRTLKYEEALALLVNEAEIFGIDLIVQDPVKFIMENMVVGYNRAITLLKELEMRDLISTHHQGTGGAIVKAIIKKKEAPERFYEIGDEKRLLKALWQLRRQSKQNTALNIVHSLVFNDVCGLADIQRTRFYQLLEEFEEKGWIQYSKSNSKRILYLTITEKFPSP